MLNHYIQQTFPPSMFCTASYLYCHGCPCNLLCMYPKASYKRQSFPDSRELQSPSLDLFSSVREIKDLDMYVLSLIYIQFASYPPFFRADINFCNIISAFSPLFHRDGLTSQNQLCILTQSPPFNIP